MKPSDNPTYKITYIILSHNNPLAPYIEGAVTSIYIILFQPVLHPCEHGPTLHMLPHAPRKVYLIIRAGNSLQDSLPAYAKDIVSVHVMYSETLPRAVTYSVAFSIKVCLVHVAHQSNRNVHVQNVSEIMLLFCPTSLCTSLAH